MTRRAVRLPASLSEFRPLRRNFEIWLSQRGSAVMSVTNTYEVMRFLGKGTTSIIYKSESNAITSWQNGADVAFMAYLRGDEWRAVPRTNRQSKKKQRLYETMVERDGSNCVYCGCDLTYETATIEHIVAMTAGGPDHLSNFALACKACNNEVDSMSGAEKIRFAVKKRTCQ